MFVEAVFVFLGFMGFLVRRNLVAIGFFYQLMFSGILLWLHRISVGFEVMTILSAVFVLLTALYGAVIIFVWRNRGTLHIDEIRELQG